MLDNLKPVTVLCGGRSTEHAISLRSAESVVNCLLQGEFDVQVIEIQRNGDWLLSPAQAWLDGQQQHRHFVNPVWTNTQPGWLDCDANFTAAGLVFPVLHGRFGEDGAIQGLLDLMQVPYVGADILGAALTINKAVCKQILQQAGLDVVPYVYIQSSEAVIDYKSCADLGEILFVKAVDGGSSIGVNRVSNAEEFSAAIDDAFAVSDGVLIETAVDGREIECAVLSNPDLMASLPGEIAVEGGVYTYAAKYGDQAATTLSVPADCSAKLQQKIQQAAVDACCALHIHGMARVDFFYDKNSDRLYVNEVNAIPGFCDISLYPQMWKASGINYKDLLDRLIAAAKARFEKRQHLLVLDES